MKKVVGVLLLQLAFCVGLYFGYHSRQAKEQKIGFVMMPRFEAYLEAYDSTPVKVKCKVLDNLDDKVKIEFKYNGGKRQMWVDKRYYYAG